MMDEEIKERVKATVDLSEWIRRDGITLTGGPLQFKALCPFHQEKSPSFTVANKEATGWFFHCFGCDASGDLFEWIMRRKGLAFPQALRLAANSIGISIPERTYQPDEVRQAKTAPAASGFNPDKYRALVPGGKVWAYLTEKRKLDAGLLVDYSVGETLDGEAYSFAYKWRPAQWPANREKPLFEFCKVVRVDRPEGKKIEWRDPKGAKNILFGMCSPMVLSSHLDGGELVICEGEIDAITWAQFGYPAVSVPSGAKYLGWIDLCWEWLQRFKKIHIAFDEDNAGRAKVIEIVTRLGLARTDIIRLPEKEIAA